MDRTSLYMSLFRPQTLSKPSAMNQRIRFGFWSGMVMKRSLLWVIIAQTADELAWPWSKPESRSLPDCCARMSEGTIAHSWPPNHSSRLHLSPWLRQHQKRSSETCCTLNWIKALRVVEQPAQRGAPYPRRTHDLISNEPQAKQVSW